MTGALYVARPGGARSGDAVLLVAAASTSRRARSTPKEGAARFDTGWLAARVARGPVAAIDAASGVALRARRRDGRAAAATLLAERARGRDRAGPGDARLVVPRRRSRRDGREAAYEQGVIVRELAGHGPAARLVRLLDERGGPGAAGRRSAVATRTARARCRPGSRSDRVAHPPERVPGCQVARRRRPRRARRASRPPRPARERERHRDRRRSRARRPRRDRSSSSSRACRTSADPAGELDLGVAVPFRVLRESARSRCL